MLGLGAATFQIEMAIRSAVYFYYIHFFCDVTTKFALSRVVNQRERLSQARTTSHYWQDTSVTLHYFRDSFWDNNAARIGRII